MTVVISQAITSKKTADTGTIPYKTLDTFDEFEIRLYDQTTVATTTFEGRGYSRNASEGFRRIASYIFGGNDESKQIAMTSPVQMSMGENESMSFYMPPQMTMDDLPNPTNPYVTVHTQPARIVAVMPFGGWASDKVIKNKYNRLCFLLNEHGIDFIEGVDYFGYNPPYQVINRLNEVVIELPGYTPKKR